jgi:hypothetical protein
MRRTGRDENLMRDMGRSKNDRIWIVRQMLKSSPRAFALRAVVSLRHSLEAFWPNSLQPARGCRNDVWRIRFGPKLSVNIEQIVRQPNQASA